MGVAIRKEYLLDEDIDEIALELHIHRNDMHVMEISLQSMAILYESLILFLDDENLDKLFLDLTEKVISYCI